MPDKQVFRVEFPLGGRSDRNSFERQPPYTTIAARNVWPKAQKRERGGSRPGFTRAYTTLLNSTVVGLGSINYISAGAIATKLVAVTSNGTVYAGSTIGGAMTSVGTVSLTANSVVTMTERNQKMYIATRGTPAVYDPALGTVTSLVASPGAVPQGCVNICTWRDRLVLSGGTTDPYGVFMSRQGEPEDWDVSEQDTGAAVDLGLASAGQIGEIVTALAPHADNCLLIWGPTTTWMLQGDPLVGGALMNLSQSIGCVDANAWCATPDGMIVFLSADGLYMIQAGCSSQSAPTSLSREKLPTDLLNIDNRVTSGGKVVSLAYDVRWRGVHIFVADRDSSTSTARYSYLSGGYGSNLSSSTSTAANNVVHWFMDWETKSLWEVQYGSGAFDPWCCHARRNYPSSESVVICGCRDGYLRYYLSTKTKDDEGYSTEAKIKSYVVMGPLADETDLTSNVRVDELEAALSAGSGDVTWTLFRGNSPEEAVTSITNVTESSSGHLASGRSLRFYPRVAGGSLYLMLSSTVSWAFESCRLLLSRIGRTRL